MRRSCISVTAITLLLVALLGSQTASAVDDCMQDVYQANGNKQTLNCTANDVTLSSVSNICITDPLLGSTTGCQEPNADGKLTCIAGQPFTFEADYTMPLTAQARYDLGLFIAEDGGGDDGALTGQCADNVLTPANALDYLSLDGDDTCGDINDAHNPQTFRQTITAMCNGAGDGGQVVLDYCTSWRQPGANDTCDTTVDTDDPANWDAFPGSPSKCNCGDVAIDVFSETATIEVTKSAVTPEVPETGGPVTYAVSVKNLATVASVTLDTFTDTDVGGANPPYVSYGDITSVQGDITSTTCTLATIAAGATYNCQFTVSVASGAHDTGDTIWDQVQACGTDDFGHTNLCDDDDASVTVTDVQTDPNLTKTAMSTQSVAVVVNFGVAVYNNSSVDSMDLTSMSDDKFGDITTTHAAGGGFGEVTYTDCSIPQTIAANGNYTCTFRGVVTTEALHTNTVTGAATDDDGIVFGAPELQDSAQVKVTVTFP